MSTLLEQLHFLRPAWLLAIPAMLLLCWLSLRRSDVRARWRNIIAPHLLDALIVGHRKGWRIRPVYFVTLLVVIGSVGLAGPAWERELPPFTEDKAPMVVMLSLAQTMDAIDVQPTRLERAKQKIRDLLKLRPGARTALFVYSGSAHMVLPLTDDPDLMETFLASLSTGLMPVKGADPAGALRQAEDLLQREEAPGTILFIADSIEAGAFPAFTRHEENSTDQIMVLGVGTARGGPVQIGENRFLTDASGRRVTSRLDVQELQRLRHEAGIRVTTLTLDNEDVDWIQRRAQSHLEIVQQETAEERWKDAGWFLVIPFAILAALWFRRGWTVRWFPMAMLAAVFLIPAPSSVAGTWTDLFFTADQQGGRHFEKGEYTQAAGKFEDIRWKGIAYYRAGEFEQAINQFALLDIPEGHFYLGNCYAKMNSLPAAAESYREALRLRPDFPEAEQNLRLVESLIEQEKEEEPETEEGGEPNLAPDEIKFDEKGKKGKEGEMEQTLFSEDMLAEMWMRNIQTSPAGFLRYKFRIQAEETGKGVQK